jgi:hypothetical protein
MGLGWDYVRTVSPARLVPGRVADARFKHQHKHMLSNNFRDALHVDAVPC